MARSPKNKAKRASTRMKKKSKKAEEAAGFDDDVDYTKDPSDSEEEQLESYEKMIYRLR